VGKTAQGDSPLGLLQTIIDYGDYALDYIISLIVRIWHDFPYREQILDFLAFLCAYDLLGIPHLRLHSQEGIESKRELLLLFDTRADHKQVSLLLPSLTFEDQCHR
jgi:hypothetical protein